MDMLAIFKAASDFGLGIVLPIMGTVFLGWLLKYVLQQNQVRENRLADIIQYQNEYVSKTLQQHDERSISAVKKLEEANNYQREEHKAIMEQHTNIILILNRLITNLDEVRLRLNSK